MKYASEYSETTKRDEFGTRTYYLYSREDIEEGAQGYIILKNEVHQLRDQAWIEVLLQKPFDR